MEIPVSHKSPETEKMENTKCSALCLESYWQVQNSDIQNSVHKRQINISKHKTSPLQWFNIFLYWKTQFN